LRMLPGGERGIRTPDRLLTYTRFPGVRLKPLIHLSGGTRIIAESGRRGEGVAGASKFRLYRSIAKHRKSP
jgi:hypothetical protein